MHSLKKITKNFILIFSTASILFFVMLCDYILNSKEANVEIYTVKKTDVQESFSIKGNVEKTGSINFITGKTKEPLDIKEGAQASVYVNGEYYDGYLQSLEKNSSSIYTASVSVISENELLGEGEAFVYGKINDDVILVPHSCVFTDEKGDECVMIVINDFCVKRKITPGKIKLDNYREIKDGLFENEKIILEPKSAKNLKTGDKVIYDY